jgi:hypothetical protein
VTPRSQQCSITVTPESVLAVMGQLDWVGVRNLLGVRDTKLACLERDTGKERWVASL